MECGWVLQEGSKTLSERVVGPVPRVGNPLTWGSGTGLAGAINYFVVQVNWVVVVQPSGQDYSSAVVFVTRSPLIKLPGGDSKGGEQ